jgi:hypothetical protein
VGLAFAEGALGGNPLWALQSAYPGLFLKGDIHLSAKGHETLAWILSWGSARVLKADQPSR